MKKSILETLFFLQIARESICIAINDSSLKDKDPLLNYVKNEASDYEVMSLITLGEMPQEKYNIELEQEVWNIFKETIIYNTSSLQEDMLQEDIMNIVYEMGPVSDLGYSSATPILEFHLFNNFLTEEPESPLPSEIKKEKEKEKKPNTSRPTKNGVQVGNNGLTWSEKVAKWKQRKLDRQKAAEEEKWNKEHPTLSNIKKTASEYKNKIVDTAKEYGDIAVTKAKENPFKSGIAAGAVGAAGLYGLYKLYQRWKAKKAAAKSSEELAAANKGLAIVSKKIKAKKSTKK